MSYITLVKAAALTSHDDDEEEDEVYTPSSKADKPAEETTGDVYETIRLINAERTKTKLPELEVDSTLMDMAAVRAEELSEVDYERWGSAIFARMEQVTKIGLGYCFNSDSKWKHHWVMLVVKPK